MICIHRGVQVELPRVFIHLHGSTSDRYLFPAIALHPEMSRDFMVSCPIGHGPTSRLEYTYATLKSAVCNNSLKCVLCVALITTVERQQSTGERFEERHLQLYKAERGGRKRNNATHEP